MSSSAAISFCLVMFAMKPIRRRTASKFFLSEGIFFVDILTSVIKNGNRLFDTKESIMKKASVNKKDDICQAEMARRMGISRQAVSVYLTGKRTPGPRMAKKLEEATGISRHIWMYPDEHHNPLLVNENGNGTR